MSARPSPGPLLVFLATIVTAVLAYFGTGLHPIWPLLWVAPVPLLAISPGLRAGIAFLVGFAAWVIAGLNEWTYFTVVLGAPLLLVVLSFVIPAIVFGLAVLFTRSFLRGGSPVLAAFAFPVFWISWEYLYSTGSPHGTFGNLAYTQMDFLPLVQISSITGIWGISFLVFLFAATVAAFLSGVGNPAERRALAASVGVLLSAVLLFGEWRMRSHPASRTVSVTLIARDVPMTVYVGPEDEGLKVLRQYAQAVRQLTPPGTQVVVLPEKLARVSHGNLPEIDKLFSSAAAATRSVVDVGLVRRTEEGSYNSARVYLPDGKTILNYDKHHLLPGIEPEKPGSRRVTLDQSSGRWGLEICKDMDFPNLSQRYAADGVSLMLVPAWDFGADRWLHARMAVLRGVENGFGLARCARQGLLTLADGRGRILAETSSMAGQFVSITRRLSISSAQTFYSRTGDWFAWICVGAFVALLVVLIGGKRNAST